MAAIAALVTTAAILGQAILGHRGVHGPIWNQGYQYGQSHAAAASLAPQTTAQWCGLAAYQVSGYSYLSQEHQWASGCTAALGGQS